jgi:GMP synthase (glutamine-hydrolysing)
VRVLSIIHGRNARSGVFGEAVRAAGHEIEERSFALGDEPDDVRAYDALIVLGGSMNVHEEADHPWMSPERRMIEAALDAGLPTLGVCLGSQLLAAVAGARVYRVDTPEIGWFDVETTPEAAQDPLLRGFPDRFRAYQWHSYATDLPDGAIELARSPVCLQAFRLGEPAWGTQFHAEVTQEILETWIASFHTDPNAVAQGFDPAAAREQVAREIGRWNELGRSLAGALVAVAAERTGAEALPARA